MKLDRLSTNLGAFALIMFLWLGGISLHAEDTDPAGGEEKEGANALDIDIEEIKATLVKTASLNVANAENAYYDVEYLKSEDKWLEVVFKYKAQDFEKKSGSKKEKKATNFIKELTFKVYVEGKDPTKEEAPVVLCGETTYVNVRKTDNNSKFRYGSFYVHPDMVDFYGMKELFVQQKGEVRIQAFLGTAPAVFGKDSKPSIKDLKETGEASWAKVFEQMPKIAGTVLSKDQTPWQWANADRFPAIKSKDAKP